MIGSGYIQGDTQIASAAYIDRSNTTSSVSTATFALLPGSRPDTRRFVGMIAWGSSIDRELSSATMGGVAATIRRQRLAGDGTRIAIIDALVLPGGGNDVVLNLDGALSGANPWAFAAVYDVGHGEYYDDDTAVAAEICELSVPAFQNAMVVGVANAFRALTAGTWSWTGSLTEDTDMVIQRSRVSTVWGTVAVDGDFLTTATNSNSNEAVAAVAVYLPPG